MHELSVTSDKEMGPDSPVCIDDQDYDTFIKNGRVLRGCGSSFAQSYFLTFTIIIAWLIMNLSVAAVIEGLENAKTENSGVIEGDHVSGLLEQWMEYDPGACGWITSIDFVSLIIELEEPFGEAEWTRCKFHNDEAFRAAKDEIYNEASWHIDPVRRILIKNKEIIKILKTYKVKTYEGQSSKIHFKDTYAILVKRVFKESEDIAEDFEVSKYLKSKMKNQWAAKHKKVKALEKGEYKVHEGFAS